MARGEKREISAVRVEQKESKIERERERESER